MSRLAIFGCGGMGRELLDIARRAGIHDLVFVVDGGGEPVLGVDVIDPAALRPDDRLCLALGSSPARKALAERFFAQPFATIIAETARVAPSAQIGEGSVICDYAVVNNSAVVGRHFQGNTYSQVSHDCIIGDYVTFSPRVSCNGWVHFEDDVFVGAGAVIRNGSPDRRLHIGKGATIGMGAVVTKDVLPGATVMGNPAKAREAPVDHYAMINGTLGPAM